MTSRKKYKSKYDGKFNLGDKYGRWTVMDATLHKTHAGKNAYGTTAVKVKCDCGTSDERLVPAQRLVTGVSTHCGCVLAAQTGSANPNWKGFGDISGQYVTGIQRASTKLGVEYSLTPEMIASQLSAQNNACALTGMPIVLNTNSVTATSANTHVTRIDPTMGFVSGNIQLITTVAHLGKQNLSHEAFIEMCHRVAERFPRPSVSNSLIEECLKTTSVVNRKNRKHK